MPIYLLYQFKISFFRVRDSCWTCCIFCVFFFSVTQRAWTVWDTVASKDAWKTWSFGVGRTFTPLRWRTISTSIQAFWKCRWDLKKKKILWVSFMFYLLKTTIGSDLMFSFPGGWSKRWEAGRAGVCLHQAPRGQNLNCTGDTRLLQREGRNK